MESIQLDCNFSFNCYLSNSMHFIVQDQSKTMEFMVITNKGLLNDFCNGTIFLHFVLDNNFSTKSDN